MKQHFPVFSQPLSPPLIYLDSAATSHVPRAVLERVNEYYAGEHSNIHRGVHFMAERATDAYEKTREAVRRFIGAERDSQIVFTSGTTHALNLVSAGFAGKYLKPGNKILLSPLEHHSNFMPWMRVARETGSELIHCALDEHSRIDPASIPFSDPNLKIIALTHVSNVTGGVQPIDEIVQSAAEMGIVTVIDGAQAAAHIPLNLTATGADFYAFSGHKIHAFTGTGILYISARVADKVDPFLFGGGMVMNIDSGDFTTLPPPQKFEAGTPNVAGVVSLGAALRFIDEHGVNLNAARINGLLHTLTEEMSRFSGLELFTDAIENTGIISFGHDRIHPHDIAAFLSERGVCVRAGHHCAKPFLQTIGKKALCRLSLGCYNDSRDVEIFLEALQAAIKFFG